MLPIEFHVDLILNRNNFITQRGAFKVGVIRCVYTEYRRQTLLIAQYHSYFTTQYGCFVE